MTHTVLVLSGFARCRPHHGPLTAGSSSSNIIICAERSVVEQQQLGLCTVVYSVVTFDTTAFAVCLSVCLSVCPSLSLWLCRSSSAAADIAECHSVLCARASFVMCSDKRSRKNNVTTTFASPRARGSRLTARLIPSFLPSSLRLPVEDLSSYFRSRRSVNFYNLVVINEDNTIRSVYNSD